jgi:hypothetical protein
MTNVAARSNETKKVLFSSDEELFRKYHAGMIIYRRTYGGATLTDRICTHTSRGIGHK